MQPRHVRGRLGLGGRLADCWHTGGVNHGCFARFDVGGTPRVTRVLTPTVESAGILRLSGYGIDGGLSGEPIISATLFRGAQPVLGACGEKDCGASRPYSHSSRAYNRRVTSEREIVTRCCTR